MKDEKISENSEGMYSYKSDDDNNNNNNINKNEINNNDTNNNNINKVPIYESDAIRRSFPNNINPEANPNPTKYQPSGMLNNNFSGGGFNNGSFVGRSSQISIELPQDSILHWSFILIYVILEVILIIVIAILFNWDKRNHPDYSCIEYNKDKENIISDNIYNETEKEISTYYGLFRDINIMAFIGFSMLHTLTHGNAWTSIAFDILSIVISFQISLFFNLIFENAFKESWKSGILNFDTFIKAIFNSCAILVSLGAVHGKISHVQYLVLIISETILSSLNFKLCDVKLKIIDTGGGLYIHTFGALFGLAIYIVLFRSKKKRARLTAYNRSNITNYLSNITCFIGVLFLLNYFPSFNAGLALSDDGRYRAVINTYFSLFGSFSGGIIISTFCSVCVDHWAAILIGMLCGLICVLLLEYLNKVFAEFGYYDIYNIIVVHCIPGILGAFISSMVISGLDRRVDNYYNVLLKDMDRDNHAQAGIQVAAIFITCAISFVGGITVGFLIKVSRCGKIREYFDDNEFFYGILNGEFANNNDERDSLTDIEGNNNQPSFINEAA